MKFLKPIQNEMVLYFQDSVNECQWYVDLYGKNNPTSRDTISAYVWHKRNLYYFQRKVKMVQNSLMVAVFEYLKLTFRRLKYTL